MHDVSLPFHARIFRIYLEYLRKVEKWDQARVDEFLSELGISSERLESDSTWLDLEFADNFYNRLVEKTGDSEIAFKAGRFVYSRSFSSAVHQLIRGLLAIKTAYKLTSRLTEYFTRASTFVVRELHDTHAVIEAIPNPNIPERPYICENRKGILSGVPQVFGLPPARLFETQCLHKGAPSCIYNLHWQSQQSWLGLGMVGIGTIVILAITWTLWGSMTAAYTALVSGLLLFTMQMIGVYRATKRELMEQNIELDSTLKTVERRNRELGVIGEISRQTHSMTSPKFLATEIVQQVCRRLDYDRAILLVVDPLRQILRVESFYGFTGPTKDLLAQTEFNIRPDNTAGFFIQVVNTKEPVFISDVDLQLNKLSPRSQKFAKLLGAKSFVAVPLSDKDGQVIGVLAVDYIRDDKRLAISDQDLLITLADHLAIALHNATMMDQLAENLETSRKFSKQQQQLRQTFQKFVPKDLAMELSNLSESDLFNRSLSQVRKKYVAIMFCDIFDFSRLSESLEPEDLVDLLNITFQHLEPEVSAFGGFVDKFTGDGFIAVFESQEACAQACHTALRLMSRMPDITDALALKNYPPIQIGLGIHFGPVILGNIGSKDRVNFTAIGESVNLASRLESHTRKLGPNSVCASHTLVEKAGVDFEWIDLKHIELKGFKDPVHAYQLKGLKKHFQTGPTPATSTSRSS